MHRVLWTALVRFGGIAIAILAVSAVLTIVLIDWQDTRYGDTAQYAGLTHLQLFFVALDTATSIVGLTLFWNLVVTIAVTCRYPIGRWTYWILFVVIVVWTTIVAIADIRPIADADLAKLGVLLTWPLTILCALIGLIEVLVQRRLARIDALDRPQP